MSPILLSQMPDPVLNPVLSPMATLAYTPFIDPLPLHNVWYLLLVPLTLLVAMAYKSVRVSDVKQFWPNAFTMWAQSLAGIVALAVCTWVLIEVLLPLLMPMPG